MDSWRGSTVRDVGRIYETRGGPDDLRWFWSMTVNGPMTRSDRVATLEEAKEQSQNWPRSLLCTSCATTELVQFDGTCDVFGWGCKDPTPASQSSNRS